MCVNNWAKGPSSRSPRDERRPIFPQGNILNQSPQIASVPGLQPLPETAELYAREGWWDGRSLVDLLTAGFERYDKTVFRIHSETRPYSGTVGEVATLARRLANSLLDGPLQAGDVIAFQLPNWMEAAVAVWGCTLAGLTTVPIPHFYGPHELRFILNQSRARVFITADRFGKRDYVEELDGIRRDLQVLEQIIVVGENVPTWARAFESLITHEVLYKAAKPRPESIAILGYTSGTNAQAKGVRLTHRGLVFETCTHMSRAMEKGFPVLMGSPVTHVTGLLVSLLLPMHFGDPIHLIDVWNPDRVLPAMLENALSAGNGAPFFFAGVLDHPQFSSRHAANMSAIAVGGSPVPPSLIERADRLGIMAWRVYGCTEHATIVGGKRSDSLQQRAFTDGKPLPGVEVRIVDADGRMCSPGQPGEIRTRGPDLCAGYVDESLNGAFDAHGWFSTGDIGVLDEQGYLTITDRLKDVIIRGGENISATEIEAMLARVDGIAEVAVVAMPDAKYGERACAFVRVKAGNVALDLQRIRTQLENFGLAKIKWPEALEIVNDFPRTPSGKIKKYVLRERLRAHPQD